jgi:hypothetical protein
VPWSPPKTHKDKGAIAGPLITPRSMMPYIPGASPADLRHAVKVMGNGYANRQIDREGTKGSVLLIVLGVVAALVLTGSLMLSKYKQNARGARTSGAVVESNALFHSIQQSINNEALCTSAFQTSSYSLTNVETGSVPPPLNLNYGLTAMVGANQVPIAIPGMKLNGVSIPQLPTGNGSASPIQLTGGSQYTNYGKQPAVGLPTDNLYCAAVNLHVVASTENRTIASTDQRSTMGSSTISEDFPMTIFTDSSGQIQKCFGGLPPSGLCGQTAAATVTSFNVAPGCIDTTATNPSATVSWTTTGAATATLTCGGYSYPVPPANLATGSTPITEAQVGNLGPTISCTLNGTNSAGVPFSATSNLFGSETICSNPSVNIYIAPVTQTCVNTGTTYVIGWTDTDLNPLATVAITGGYTYTGPLINNPSPPGGYTVPAPVAPGLVSFTIQDTLGGPPASTSITVMTAPTAPVLSASTATYATTSPPPTLTLTWATPPGDTSFSLVGSDGTNIPLAASPVSIPPPTVAGTYTYTVSGSGGCPGTPAVPSNTVNVVVTAAAPPGNPGWFCTCTNPNAPAPANFCNWGGVDSPLDGTSCTIYGGVWSCSNCPVNCVAGPPYTCI